MDNLETTTGVINDIFDKYHSFDMRFEQAIDQHIADKIYEVAGVKVDTKEDVDRLQEDYCMYLIVTDLDIDSVGFSEGNIVFKKAFKFLIEEPKPNEYGIHIMECGIMFQKDEQGKWKVIEDRIASDETDIVAHFIRQNTTISLEELCDLCRPYLSEFMTEDEMEKYIIGKISDIK